jgi:CRISPR/Cas system-associated endonuclease/helicase Cas3
MFNIPVIYDELNLESLLAVYNKLGLENPFIFAKKQMEEILCSDYPIDRKLHCISYGRNTGKTTLRIILAILASQNNLSVYYRVPSQIMYKDIEERIKQICGKLSLDTKKIINNIELTTGLEKGNLYKIKIEDIY